MSRIEEAIEKAARLRESTGGGMSPLQGPAAKLPLQSLEQEVKFENPLLIAANEPSSQIAEEFRKLKSILVKLTKQETFNNTLIVTSAMAREGKSVTSVNLAISLAQEFDHTVLLVDCDLRKPSLHKYLGIEPEKGIYDCLVEGVDIGEALVKTPMKKLTLLAAGSMRANPGDLFSSQTMKELVKEMKNRYPDRYIIIDTPPVLPFSETRLLSQIVDGVIFVVKEGAVSIHHIKDALDALKGSNLLGIVYNEANFENLKTGYNYYYYTYERPA